MPDLTNPIEKDVAVKYILSKENKPTYQKSKEIADLWNNETKTRAFFSARVAKADLLEGMRQRIIAIVEGKSTTGTARAWIRDFIETEGRSSMSELGFLTGDEAKDSDNIAELGSVRRLNLIIDQNVRMAHAVGEYAQFMENKDIAPYVEYKTREDSHVRNSHALLNNKVFKVDDPIMSRICPPQDFNCRCYLNQIDETELEGRGISNGLPEGWKPPASKYSFDVFKGLNQALPEKPQWGDDLKEKYGEDIQNPPEPKSASRKKVKAPEPTLEMLVGEVKTSKIAIKELEDQHAAATPVLKLELWKKLEESRKELSKVNVKAIKLANIEAEKIFADGNGIPWPPGTEKCIYKTRKQSMFGKAAYSRTFDAEAAVICNDMLRKLSAEAAELKLPPLMGVVSRKNMSSLANMGDGILFINEGYLNEYMQIGYKGKISTWKQGDTEATKPGFSRNYFESGTNRLETDLWHEFGHHIHQMRNVTNAVQKWNSPMKAELKTLFATSRFGIGSATKYSEKEGGMEWFCENYALGKMGRYDLIDQNILKYFNTVL